jgi:hypothetical protein
MSIDLVHKCCLCNNDFRPESLDKDGKCVSCAKQFPTVKTREAMMLLNHPEINLGEKLTAEGVRQIIKEELNAFKAELNAFKAEQKAERMAQARAAKQDKKIDESEGDK